MVSDGEHGRHLFNRAYKGGNGWLMATKSDVPLSTKPRLLSPLPSPSHNHSRYHHQGPASRACAQNYALGPSPPRLDVAVTGIVISHLLAPPRCCPIRYPLRTPRSTGEEVGVARSGGLGLLPGRCGGDTCRQWIPRGATRRWWRDSVVACLGGSGGIARGRVDRRRVGMREAKGGGEWSWGSQARMKGWSGLWELLIRWCSLAIAR